MPVSIAFIVPRATPTHPGEGSTRSYNSFRKALLREGIENFLSGEVETGKIILRDFINAAVGFTKLGNVTHRSAKSLMRMLGPRGNLQARNLFEIVKYLQETEGVRFEVRPGRLHQ